MVKSEFEQELFIEPSMTKTTSNKWYSIDFMLKLCVSGDLITLQSLKQWTFTIFI
jgi:hypothetical protein